MAAMAEPIILASASVARARLLKAAGIPFSIEPADIDETRIKAASSQADEPALTCALALAYAKARRVSERDPAALVIGADQILAAGDEWFDKPKSLAEARAQLQSLRGRTHVLATAASIVHDGREIWRATSAPEMTMRSFSEAFLDHYIAAEGKALLGSVGAYRFEGLGVQLFQRMKGDHFAVLGLPLLELLDFLRSRGALPS
jgi:septum formation protein